MNSKFLYCLKSAINENPLHLPKIGAQQALNILKTMLVMAACIVGVILPLIGVSFLPETNNGIVHIFIAVGVILVWCLEVYVIGIVAVAKHKCDNLTEKEINELQG